MATIWMFNSKTGSGHKPAITGQLLSSSDNFLCLRNPWVTDSAFMGKLYCAIITISMIGFYPYLFDGEFMKYFKSHPLLMTSFALTPFTFLPFLIYRIYFIKRLSSICFNRSTQKIYYQRLSKIFVFEWSNTGGGVFKRTEYGGSSFSTSYALAFAPRPSPSGWQPPPRRLPLGRQQRTHRARGQTRRRSVGVPPPFHEPRSGQASASRRAQLVAQATLRHLPDPG